MNVLDIEKKSLKQGRRLNVIMGIMGVTFAILSQSSALMVDGLYSMVNFASSIIAAGVSAKIAMDADEEMPFGYDFYEALYITFRALVLLGIMLFSFLGAVSKIITYITGSPVAEIKPGFILIYTVINVILCFTLAGIHKKNYEKTGNKSEILKAEQSAAMVDGMISLGAGGALMALALLKGTALDFLVPIADSIVVLVLVTWMVKEPLGLFKRSLQELLGRSLGEKLEEEVMVLLKLAVNFDKYDFIDLKILKVGRHYHALTLLKPLEPVTAADMDAIRAKVQKNLEKIDSVRSEIIFTEKKWY